MKRCLTGLVGCVIAVLLGGIGPAAAQSDAEKVGAIVEGAWYGRVDGLDRPDR